MLRQSRRLVRWEVWCTCVLDEVVCCIATKRCEEYRRTCTLSDGLESLDRAGESLGVNKVTILIAVYHPSFLSFCTYV